MFYNVLTCKKIPSFPSPKVFLHTTSGVSTTIKQSALFLFIYKPFGILSQGLMNGITCVYDIKKFPVGYGGQMGRSTYARRGVSNKRTCAYEGRGGQIFAIFVRAHLLNGPNTI